MENSKSVLGIGTAACDYMALSPFYPEVDNKVKLCSLDIQGGGPVGTALTVLSKLGLNTKFAGVLGDDDFGKFILKTLNKNKVDTEYTQIKSAIRSPFAFCVALKNSGHRTVFSIKGDKMEPDFSENTVDEIISQTNFIHVDGSVPETSLKFLKKAAGKIPSMIDIGALKPGIIELMEKCDYKIASYQFMKEYYKNNYDFHGFLKKIFTENTQLSGVTLGKNGSIFYDGHDFFETPAVYNPHVVDTTGCGDIFHGAFIYGLLQNWDYRKCAEFASAVSSVKVSSLGGQKIKVSLFPVSCK